MEVLDDTFGKASLREDRVHLFRNCWCLWRGLDDHSVPCEEGGNERVDEDKVRILDIS